MNEFSEREKLLIGLLRKETNLSYFMSATLHGLMEIMKIYAKDAPKMIDKILDAFKELEEKYPEFKVEYDKDDSS